MIRRLHLAIPSLWFLATLLWSPPAAAYIDPGTGSALVYVVTGVVISTYFFARGLFYRALEVVSRRRYGQQVCDLAIHCESPRYETSFIPVIRHLAKHKVSMTLFTMYPRDESYTPLPEGVVHREIAPGMVGYAHLNHLEAQVLLTTTPQIDVMTFRRAKKVKHYIMMQHALGESRYVRPYAYDFFDTVLCCGEIVKHNIRKMERIRGLPQKSLLETGVPHYDEFLKSVIPNRPRNPRPLVLVAPSWGPLSIFQAFGTELVERLARCFDVLVRPHPQMKQSQPELYQRVLNLHGVEVDTDPRPLTAMVRADILVSDISGIAHEFAFIHEKPVIVVDHDVGLGGLEGEVLGGKSELRERCREFIVPIPPERMTDIAQIVDEVLKNHSSTIIRSTREKTVYNFGSASEVAANQIAGILACQ